MDTDHFPPSIILRPFMSYDFLIIARSKILGLATRESGARVADEAA